jgi:FixJ family two-component response regulator
LDVRSRSTALLIDDDTNGTLIFGYALQRDGFDVLTAETGRAGVSIASSGAADVVLLDQRLPDLSGIEVLRIIKHERRAVPVIMMTAYSTTELVVQAMRLGAADFLEKPLTPDEVLQAVHAALAVKTGSGARRAEVPVSHAAARWADAVVKVIDAPQDPRTLQLWGRQVGASTGSLRNWCRMAGLSPKRSLSLARMIRAITYAPSLKRPEDVFNVTDRRTLRQLLTLGDPNRRPALPDTLEEFFERQRWISSPSALQELKRLLQLRRNRKVDHDSSD